MIGAMVGGTDCVTDHTQRRPGLEQMVGTASCVEQAYDAHVRPVVEKLMAVALRYVQEAGLVNAAVEVRDKVAVLTNAPFCGEVPICGIEDGHIVPYF